MLQKSGRLVLWEAMFILELHSAETQVSYGYLLILSHAAFERLHLSAAPQQSYPGSYAIILFLSICNDILMVLNDNAF